MSHPILRKTLSLLMSFVLVVSLSLPVSALAVQSEVTVDNYVAQGDGMLVSGLAIDSVDAPSPGIALDDAATVTSVEGGSWEVPVLWIADDMQLATQAEDSRAYLPAIAFFVPQGYTLEGNSFQVVLSDSLTKLFGGSEVVSVYDSATGITYILPASLRGFFTSSPASADSQEESFEPYSSSNVSPAAASADSAAEPQFGADLDPASMVEVYCSDNARLAFSDEDLQYLLDLVVNRLEPQAVNLLNDRFPAFSEASEKGEIGTRIGLYVYFLQGDEDDWPEHEKAAPKALAYVARDALDRDGEPAFYYMIGVDISSLIKVNKKGEPITTKKYKGILLRSGEKVVTFNNTIVHELFHAFQNDYNRTGMLGAKRSADMMTPASWPAYVSQQKLFNALSFPRWFKEGSASAVENVYQYRHEDFKYYRVKDSAKYAFYRTLDAKTLLNNYQNARASNGEFLYYDLGFCNGRDADGNKVDPDEALYVSGYLAVLYLGELAARSTTGSSVSTKGGKTKISSEKIRLGLNYIYKQMHEGKTLDQVIKAISPKDANGKKLYKSTRDFEMKFIKGVEVGNKYKGDKASISFVTKFLNYMLELERQPGRKNTPNGSILFDFERDFKIPLDPSKKAFSNYLRIVASNKYEKSTVPDSVACFGGGKSDPPRTVKLVAASAGSSKALEAGAAAAKASAAGAPKEGAAGASKVSAGAAKASAATPDRALGSASAEEKADGVVEAAEADVVQDAQVAGAEKAAECAGVAESDESAEPAEAARTAEAGESDELAEPAEAGEPAEAEGSAETGESSEADAASASDGESPEPDAEIVADTPAAAGANAGSSDTEISDDAVATAAPAESECDSAASDGGSALALEGDSSPADTDAGTSDEASDADGAADAADSATPMASDEAKK